MVTLVLKDCNFLNSSFLSSCSCHFFEIPSIPFSQMENQLKDAVQNNQVEEVRALLRDHPGVDINPECNGGWTCLHYSAQHGFHEVAKLLLAHPAINVNSRTWGGSTPFDLGSLGTVPRALVSCS